MHTGLMRSLSHYDRSIPDYTYKSIQQDCFGIIYSYAYFVTAIDNFPNVFR